MCRISRQSAPIHVVVHYPATEQGRRDLAVRAAGVHAELVGSTLQKLECPPAQKCRLLEAVLETVKKRTGGQTG